MGLYFFRRMGVFSLLLCGFMLSVFFSPVMGEPLNSVTPQGSWQTIDDVSNQPRSVMLLTVSKEGELTGKITKINYRPGEGEGDVCAKCRGSLHNARILGLTILTGMKQNKLNPLLWEGGQIVDPESGKSYRCKMNLSPDGKQMIVRGFIMFSFIGRNQTWVRLF